MKLALKLRPKTLDELIGQQSVKNELEKMGFPEKSISNLFIISSKSGTGKTSTARIMSNMLDGNIIEINAVTQAGVDDIRELERIIKTRPITHSTTCVILDEAHNLQKRASESLLKVLEELPDYVYVFLCTTSPQDIIDTIRARAYPLTLNPIDDKTMFNYIESVAIKEKIKIENSTIKDIVKNAKGSVRDALNLLVMYDTSGTIEQIPQMKLQSMFTKLQNNEIDNSIEILKELLVQGHEPLEILVELTKLAFKENISYVDRFIRVAEKLSIFKSYQNEILIPLWGAEFNV